MSASLSPPISLFKKNFGLEVLEGGLEALEEVVADLEVEDRKSGGGGLEVEV